MIAARMECDHDKYDHDMKDIDRLINEKEVPEKTGEPCADAARGSPPS